MVAESIQQDEAPREPLRERQHRQDDESHPQPSASIAVESCRESGRMGRGIEDSLTHLELPTPRTEQQESRPESALSGATAGAFPEFTPTGQAPDLPRVDCPFCLRKFTEEAAKRHVPVCGNLRSRPKPPPKSDQEWFTDNLGIRHGSRGNLCSVAKLQPKLTQRAQPMLGSEKVARSKSSKADDVVNRVKDEWGQVELLLRGQWKLDGGAVDDLGRRAEEGLRFLDGLASVAERVGVTSGVVSRWVLPFDSETDANDQANCKVQHVPESEALTPGERDDLTVGALSVRRLVRVKMADDNDLKQAKCALECIAKFHKRVVTIAEHRGQSVDDTLRRVGLHGCGS